MPAGGLIQLVAASGEQDLYLVGDPQITFFKTVYRRHTNFSLETRKEVLNNSNFGKTAHATIHPVGDLVSNMTLYLRLGSLNPKYDAVVQQAENNEHVEMENIIGEGGTLNQNVCACSSCIEEQYKEELMFGWVNSLGHALVKSTVLRIGGMIIDKQYGEWMEIWSELTQTQEKRNSYYQMIGKVDPTSYTATTSTGEMELYIPLNFWFCRNVGLALPIMCLYYHQVEIEIDFRKFDECWVKNKSEESVPKMPYFDATLLIDYIYLDIEERKEFYENSHMYLIEQTQTSDEEDASYLFNTINFFFNHPLKEIVWFMQRDDVIGEPLGLFPGTNYPIGNDWFNYSLYKCRSTARTKDTFDQAILQFNGQNRFDSMPASYFRLYQPYYRHTRNPINYIYMYAFGLKPEEHQPTGHLNASRVNNLRMVIKNHDKRTNLEKAKYKFKAYVTNYNILAVSNGMGGTLFTC